MATLSGHGRLIAAGALVAATSFVLFRMYWSRKPKGILVRKRKPSRKPNVRAKWDEDTLAQHLEERGKLYGTMKITHPDTPYLYYEHDEEKEIVREYVKGEHPKQVSVNELQERLGLLHLAQEAGEGVVPQAAETPERPGGGDRDMSFEEKRKAHYRNEAAACANAGGKRAS